MRKKKRGILDRLRRRKKRDRGIYSSTKEVSGLSFPLSERLGCDFLRETPGLPQEEQVCRRVPEPTCDGLSSLVIRKMNVYSPAPLDEHPEASRYLAPKDTDRHRLLFLPSAVRELQAYIGWGCKEPYNETEQQGILLGQVYRTSQGAYVGFVEHVLLSQAQGNAVYVESDHTQWSAMDRQMDELNASRSLPLVKVGWWHTHPNMSVFMSSTDRMTQSLYFHKSWQFAVVLNPQAKIWKAFIGEEATECPGQNIRTVACRPMGKDVRRKTSVRKISAPEGRNGSSSEDISGSDDLSRMAEGNEPTGASGRLSCEISDTAYVPEKKTEI